MTFPGGHPLEPFEAVFRTSNARRDNFLARLFGLFSEEVVRIWAACPEGTYRDLGRPTLRSPASTRGYTLDFTLEARETGRIYVAEQKCELAYENYRYLRLEGPDQVAHHEGGQSFQRFLEAARTPSSVAVRVHGREHAVDGAILVWGASTPQGRDAVMAQYGVADVLALENMLHDLSRWNVPGWADRVQEWQTWTQELFTYLVPSE